VTVTLVHSPNRGHDGVVELTEMDDGYWRFSERDGDGDTFSFDFRAAPADEALFARKYDALQFESESMFVQNLVVQQRKGERHVSLRGRVLSSRDPAGESKRLVESADAFVTVLREQFGLELPGVADLWDKVCARHEQLFP
jgi:N-hydroxyarylamine O-acetyltransferase